jgi:phenylacetate-CoA ligase
MPIMEKLVARYTFPLIARSDGLKGLYNHFGSLNKSQFWSSDQIQAHQVERTRSLLVHAYQNTTYYKKLFTDCGLNPFEFQYMDELTHIPYLTKNRIRDNLNDLVAQNHRPGEIHQTETGGTTGVKMAFYRDNASLAPKEAARYRFEQWAGWDFGKRIGIVWPARQDYVGHWTLKAKFKNELYQRSIVFPATVMDDESIGSYVSILKRKPVATIRAFTSPLHEVAKYLIRNGIDNVRLKGAVTTGEPLFIHQRKLISKAFCCPVYDSYRCREAGTIAQECDVHDGLHTTAELLFIETAPIVKGEFEDSDMGEIVVTDLCNYGMPLIRYRMGDLGILTNAPCDCGRALPRLKKIAGRTPDIFYTVDGKPIVAITLVLYLVDEAPGQLGQVQIIQDTPKHIILRMTPDPPPTEAIKEYQVRKTKELMGPEMKVSFEIVDHISREPSGKYTFTKCLIDKADLANAID